MEIIREILKVKDKRYITPHLIRVTLTGKPEHIASFGKARIGANNKIFIPSSPITYSSFEEEYEKQKENFFNLANPTRRTYTHRFMDLEKNEIAIDFVAHGDNGVASAWAISATEGDILGVAMKVNSKSLFPDAANYFLAGDATAIPVLSAILEQLKRDVNVSVLLEVHGPEDELQLYSEAKMNVKWIHNPTPEKGSSLFTEFEQLLQQPVPTEKFAYVAAEFRTVKQIRNLLKNQLNWDKSEFYAYSYWKSGQAEDQSEVTRRDEKNQSE